MARAKRQADKNSYVLKLYVTGATRRSQRAIENLNEICDRYLQGHYELEVVDIYQSPFSAKEANIVAAPTLVKQLPEPMRQLIGDLSERNRVLMLLGLKPRMDSDGEATKPEK